MTRGSCTSILPIHHLPGPLVVYLPSITTEGGHHGTRPAVPRPPSAWGGAALRDPEMGMATAASGDGPGQWPTSHAENTVFQIPPDLVVDSWASSVESRS